MDLREYRAKQKDFIRHPYESARIQAINILLSKYIKKETLTVLDVGTGDGFALERICSNFKKAQGLGFDTFLTKQETDRLNSDFKDNNIDVRLTSLKQEAEDFARNTPPDLICLMDILEHIKDDKDFFGGIIKDYGIKKPLYLFITVPAYNWLFSLHDKNLGHYRRYCLKDISKVVICSGAEIKDCGYMFFSGFLVRCLGKLLEKCFHFNKTIGNVSKWNHGALLTNLLRSALMADFYFGRFVKHLGIILPGLSIYLIASKK